MARDVGVYTGAGMAAYGFTRGSLPDGSHYMRPDRFARFARALASSGLADRCRELDAAPASDEELALFHDPAYLADMRARCAADQGALDHGPTPAQAHMPAAAASVVGAVLDAARRLCSGELRRAFVPIAGFHHGRPDRAVDYCLLNDCAVLLTWLKRQLPGQTLAYVDIDAHHGDAVWDTFIDDPDVVLIDIHQDAHTFWYSRGDEQEPGDVDRPRARARSLQPGAGDHGLLAAWTDMLPWLNAAAPRFVVLNAGADGLAGDLLTGLDYSPATHARVTRDLVILAERHAGGRLLALGGGGYNPDRFSAAWIATLAALLSD